MAGIRRRKGESREEAKRRLDKIKKEMEETIDETFDTVYNELEENRDRLIKYVIVASFISGFLGGGVFVGLYILTT